MKMNLSFNAHEKKGKVGSIFTVDELGINSLCYYFNKNFDFEIIRNETIELESNVKIKINDVGRVESIEKIEPVVNKFSIDEFLQMLEPLFNEMKSKIKSYSHVQYFPTFTKNITFVTCIYDDLFETEFGGRVNPSRKYLFGVESALKMGCPFVIFTWEKDVERLETYYKEIIGEENYDKKIKIVPYNLYDTPIREIIKLEKSKPQNADIPGDRCHDVMFGKFFMVQKCIEENYFGSENFFWIDAGLSSSALFPNKYLDNSIPEKQYSECSLFSPKVIPALLQSMNGKILLVKCNSIGYWFEKEHLPNSEGVLWYIIGGIFGGDKILMKKYCDDIINSFLYHISEHSMLYFEECIMTIDYAFNQEKYSVVEFDTWHHEDSGDWAQPFIEGKKNFYKIFEKFNEI